MATETNRGRAVEETRARILDVARELLGERPDAGMGEIAVAAGVVRRTVYGHFPARDDLVRTLAEQAATEIRSVVEAVDRPEVPADEAWTKFVRQLWPLTHRYRVLLALRRGAYGEEIHDVLGSVDAVVGALIRRGQNAGAFGTHLPPDALGRIGYTTVFAVAGDRQNDPAFDVQAAIVTSLLVLGVRAARAHELAALPSG